ncbi:acyl-CoA dehydrogenase-like protein [Phanerochaete sordida]|uniref:Acyl-CoA dehydrogenase-like protein n=1 Tax=Phanerochaete sordida TaxID=48140 RepID=A0A9P3GSM9_9APHY|nr:acyl-CoA dehydrogenase-like protein [Phanerochaete sordida]
MSQAPQRALHLPDLPAFAMSAHTLGRLGKTQLAYARAKELVLAYNLTIDDVADLTPKFWELHRDPVCVIDGAAMTLATIQVNLTAGTIAKHAVGRPGLRDLVDDLLKYRKHGQFLMTELGHGLDIANLETTATALPSGEFVLNTPSPEAAKFMPPTIPAGLPTVGIVWAKLIIGGNVHGIHPFLVALNDGRKMCAGVQCRLLPERGGTSPVNHALTSFHNVRLSPEALLGSIGPTDASRPALAQSLWRVACGTIAIGCSLLPVMKCYATVGAMYSFRRHVGSPGSREPIISFRTQQIPILVLTAQVYVMEAFVKWCTTMFSDTSVDYRVRHAIGGILKATIVGHANAGGIAVSDRCGAQGLFAHNQMTTMHNETRGMAIAEGDVLALSIKFAMEMLQGRYAVPDPRDPSNYLARHEADIFQEACSVAASCLPQRSSEVNRRILPRCQAIIEAMGHRMAYEAAVAAGVQQSLVDLYVVSCMRLDGAWYVEKAGVTRETLAEMEIEALDAVLPDLARFIHAMGIDRYVTAKIVSDERWASFVETLPLFEGEAAGCLFSVETWSRL